MAEGRKETGEKMEGQDGEGMETGRRLRWKQERDRMEADRGWRTGEDGGQEENKKETGRREDGD